MIQSTMLKCVLCSITLAASMAVAQSATPQDSPKADNTAVNQRDRNAAEPTADQQKATTSDRETSRKIRQAIVHDKSLSTYAHNVKIISEHGTVTLKGPVRSEEEKQAVEKMASDVAGAENVKSEIQVAAKSDR